MVEKQERGIIGKMVYGKTDAEIRRLEHEKSLIVRQQQRQKQLYENQLKMYKKERKRTNTTLNSLNERLVDIETDKNMADVDINSEAYQWQSTIAAIEKSRGEKLSDDQKQQYLSVLTMSPVRYTHLLKSYTQEQRQYQNEAGKADAERHRYEEELPKIVDVHGISTAPVKNHLTMIKRAKYDAVVSQKDAYKASQKTARLKRLWTVRTKLLRSNVSEVIPAALLSDLETLIEGSEVIAEDDGPLTLPYEVVHFDEEDNALLIDLLGGAAKVEEEKQKEKEKTTRTPVAPAWD